MIYEKPDGKIEIQGSGCCCPPGQRHRGMHTNACTNWWRTVRDGQASPWHNLRQHGAALELAQAATTCDEFVEAMKP